MIAKTGIVPFEVFKLTVDFFLNQKKLGQFLKQDPGQPGDAERFTTMINDYVREVYNHGYFDGHHHGVLEARDSEETYQSSKVMQ